MLDKKIKINSNKIILGVIKMCFLRYIIVKSSERTIERGH